MILLRSVIFVIWLYSFMLALGIIALPCLLLPPRFSFAAIRVYARIILFGLRWICNIRVELRGREHIKPGPLIIAGKHQAMLDVFIPFLLFKDPMIVMKRELMWYPFFGWYAMKTRQLPIDRGGLSKTLKDMLKRARKLVPANDGRQLLIYPEGTRTKPGAAPAYQSAGIRAFYKSLKLPILPLATNSGQCWPARGILRRPGTVVYEVLPPLPAGLPHAEMTERLQEELETASTRLLNLNDQPPSQSSTAALA